MAKVRRRNIWIREWPGPGYEADGAVKLICFHHGGGGASSFSSWRRLLPPAIELLRVQLPGREDRADEMAHGDIESLIPALTCQLAPLFDRPVAFYGHSLGAIIAFEALRRLRRQSLTLPVALFVSGRRAPHLPLSHPAYSLASDEGLVEYLATMGGMSARLLTKPHWRSRLFPLVRQDLRISDLYVYRHEAPLPCPIVYFAGAADRWVKPHEWQGWQLHGASEFRTRVLAGGHFFTGDEHAVIVADVVACLQRYLNFDLSVAGTAVSRPHELSPFETGKVVGSLDEVPRI